MLYLAALILLMTLSANVFADDKMYKCDDGTFTNLPTSTAPPMNYAEA